MEHDDCDDLPPPPGHPDEGLGQGCQSQRLLVSPRPIKNPVHDIQQVLLQLHLSGQQSCKMRRESFWVTLCHEGTLFISWKEPRLGIFSSLIQLVTLLTLDYKSLCFLIFLWSYWKKCRYNYVSNKTTEKCKAIHFIDNCLDILRSKNSKMVTSCGFHHTGIFKEPKSIEKCPKIPGKVIWLNMSDFRRTIGQVCNV